MGLVTESLKDSQGKVGISRVWEVGIESITIDTQNNKQMVWVCSRFTSFSSVDWTVIFADFFGDVKHVAKHREIHTRMGKHREDL